MDFWPTWPSGQRGAPALVIKAGAKAGKKGVRNRVVGRTTGLLQARVPFELVASRSPLDDLDHLVEELIAEDMAGYAIVADALRFMLARPPVLELLVHDVGAAGVALTVGDDRSGIRHSEPHQDRRGAAILMGLFSWTTLVPTRLEMCEAQLGARGVGLNEAISTRVELQCPKA